MTTFIKSKAVKAVVGLLAIAVIFGGVGFKAKTADAACTAYTFGSGTYKYGSTSTYVKEIQQFLNANGFTVSTTGAGSMGAESTYFGTKTKAAVMAFQSAKALVADGYYGILSRAAMLAMQANNCTMGGGGSQSGPVTAMLSTDNPAAGTLVAGQATADLAHFTFSGTGTVTNVTLQRVGVSSDTTPSNVYLFDGATRLTDAASVANGGMVTFNNAMGLFTVSGSRTISIRSDILAGTSGQTLGMKLISFMTTASTTAVTANLSGNIHTIATATLATVTHTSVTPSGATINPAAAITLWQDTLSISTRDVWMKRISLRNIGSAPSTSFANFKLYVNGVQVATSAGMTADGYVTFDMTASPVLLVSGSRVVRVDADVISGASRTVQLSLRQAADVDFVDSSFGVNIVPTSTPWTATTASTISGTTGGTLTIEKDITSPSTNATLGGNDVVLGIFKVTAYGEPIKIETLKAGQTFTDGGTVNAAATLRNGRVLIGGVQYGSTATLIDAATGTSFTTNYTVYPGTPVLVEVRADIYDNDGTGTLDSSDTILAKIVAGSSNAQRIDSLGSFSAPSTSVSANTLSIASASATLTKNGTYANQTTTLPATNFKIGSWNLTGSSVEDILLTTLSWDVDESTGTEFDEGDITNIYPVVKNSAGAIVAQPSPLSTASTGADLNYSINYTLPKSSTLTIELYANLADDGLDMVAGVSGGSNAIDATDAFQTDLTVTGTALISGSSVNASSGDIAGQAVAYGASTITATVAAASPVTGIVYDNQTITSGVFQFAAVTSGFNVTDVTLTLPAGGATVAQSVMLYDGANLIATAAGGTTTVTFTGLTWNVPANTQKDLTVKLQLGTIGLGAGTSKSSLLTTLTSFTSVSTSTGVSDVSANDAGQSEENNPAAADLISYASVPTVSQASVSTSLINAIENDMYSFTVNPNGGNMSIKQLKLTIVVNDNVGTNDTLTVGSFKLFRGSTDITSLVDIHNTAGATIESTNSLAEGTSTAIVTWATDEQISASTTYTLKATPAGFSTAADDDYINVTLAYDSSAQTTANTYLLDLDSTTAQTTVGLQNLAGNAADGTIAATVTTGPNFVWSDMSSIPHTTTVVDDADAAQDAPTSSADWFNGFLVQSMPLAGMTKNN